MNVQTKNFLIPGPVGQLQCAVNSPDAELFPQARGLALVAHPHPLFGGTMDNKVAQTLARTFVSLGYVTVRMNFRGVGQSEGVHDAGIGETDDMEVLLKHMRQEYPNLPLVLSGFSFGTYVQSRLNQRLSAAGIAVERLVLVGAAAGKWPMPDIPADTILIHGELDDTIPLQAVFEWLRPQDIPVVVIPGADHFFHKRLPHIKKIISDLWN
ncbi:alpha/beta hydrolase [Undibacterium cyanobacteriorum]|uniref:Alpha/beta hydrolase n=1 Tax=Undibacterium cyanobacteriorum TaxID=3073561 RepID=A0ABY9RK14_9BURK|nr:alpha/beta hydrolase [Undibacterium sp. 20NA77.5]WMW81184.1 alpha/beta hydrolase [Undibacterium sp. 20NA77.5]